MELSIYAKFANSKEDYEKLRKFVDNRNACMNSELPMPTIQAKIDTKALEKELDKAIVKTIDTAMKKICKK
jgi:hypothetical protein